MEALRATWVCGEREWLTLGGGGFLVALPLEAEPLTDFFPLEGFPIFLPGV